MNSIDPEVRLLLEQVVKDPSSTLTRFPERGFGGWLRSREPLSGDEHFLTRAEKHLIRVHRESVAFLLYQGCQRSVLSGPSAAIALCRKLKPDLEVSPPEKQDLSTQASRELDSSSNALGRDLLMALSTSLSPTGVSLAAASLALVPRDETRIWLGLAFLTEGRLRPSRQCFLETLAGRPGTLNRSLAFADLGFIELVSARLQEAWEDYHRAADTDEQLPLALTGWMNTSLLTGNRRDLLEAAWCLQNVSTESSLGECRSGIESIFTNWLRHGAGSSRLNLERVWEELPPAARHIYGGVRREAGEP